MNTSKGHVAVRASVLAVRAALFAMAVSPAVYAADPAPAPADPAVVALTQPTNFIEAGVGYVTRRVVQVRAVQRTLRQGTVRHLQLRHPRRHALRHQQRGALARRRHEPGPRYAHLHRGGGPARHVSPQRGLRRAAQQLHGQLPDAIPGQRDQPVDAAGKLAEAGCSAGEPQRRQFPRTVPDDRNRADHRERRGDPTHAGATKHRRRNHRRRRPLLQQPQPRHGPQSLFAAD